MSPYPTRPVLDVLAEFKNTNSPRSQSPEQQARLLEFVAHQYEEEGRSLRELAELTGRTQTVLCTCQGRQRRRAALTTEAVTSPASWRALREVVETKSIRTCR